jgi:DNA-directed primase/polymerase protein
MFKSITTDAFYGDSPKFFKELESPRLLDRRFSLKNRPADLLNYDSRTWRVFERQDEALKFVKRRDSGLKTFVFHSGGVGTRLFLAAHPKEFWLQDQLKDQSQRCAYEVIPEFTPCKLYLDLEYDVQLNPNSNGPEMVEIFIKLILVRLKQLYSLTAGRNMVLDLDSTTSAKFSRHLIFQNPICSYANNYVVGMIVKDVCDKIRCWNEELSQEFGVDAVNVGKLFVKNRHGKTVLFCDEGVYTKNRHFRMYRSTKPLKNAPLVLSPDNTFCPPMADPEMKEEYIFLSSLITYLEPFLIDVAPYEYECPVGTVFKLFPNSSQGNSGGVCDKLPSPFPEVDRFAITEMEAEGIRSWVHFSSNNCIIYDSKRSTFCGNIGRFHKSNKSMLVVNMSQYQFYRKCHDPDCRGYQSEPKALPSYLVTTLQHPDITREESKEVKDILELLESSECDFN